LLSAFSFQFAQCQTETVLHSFSVDAGGAGPRAVVVDSAGDLYGATYLGGDLACGGGFGCGTIFKLDSHGNETLLYTFTGGADGSFPDAGLVRDSVGNLYGTASEGGNLNCDAGNGCGTVFKLAPSGVLTVLHRFAGVPDGRIPHAALFRDASGNLYGTTTEGGDAKCKFGAGCGTIFQLDPAGRETILYKFHGKVDGKFPEAGVVRDAGGNLFGTATQGGSGDGGTAFKIDKTGKLTVLHSFGGSEGSWPFSGLLPNGSDLYGMTENGGAFGYGIVFKVDKAGNETILYNFTGKADGGSPFGDLIHDPAGNLYGVTTFGGSASPYGVVFRLTTAGEETVLYSFTGGLDGQTPNSKLFRDAAGNLYGSTSGGGTSDWGVVFKITP
jgi:uncharacterized repeat protein (TIGR03803 family)